MKRLRRPGERSAFNQPNSACHVTSFTSQLLGGVGDVSAPNACQPNWKCVIRDCFHNSPRCRIRDAGPIDARHATSRHYLNSPPNTAPPQQISIQPPNKPAAAGSMFGNMLAKKTHENGSKSSVGRIK